MDRYHISFSYGNLPVWSRLIFGKNAKDAEKVFREWCAKHMNMLHRTKTIKPEDINIIRIIPEDTYWKEKNDDTLTEEPVKNKSNKKSKKTKDK